MDDKHTMGSVPPYEANPSQGMQHTGSYGAAPGQPTVQQDIYQQPISPMQTGQVYNQTPISPIQTGPTYPPQQPNTTMDQAYFQQPQQQQQQQTGTVGSPGNEKQEYYGGAGQQQQQRQPEMQQQQQQMGGAVPMQQIQSQYQTATPLANLGEAAAPVDCPVCRQRALTRTEFHAGNTTHAWALVICACFCLGCIPYLINSLKDVEHKCGSCGVFLATWKRSGRTVVHQHA